MLVTIGCYLVKRILCHPVSLMMMLLQFVRFFFGFDVLAYKKLLCLVVFFLFVLIEIALSLDVSVEDFISFCVIDDAIVIC